MDLNNTTVEKDEEDNESIEQERRREFEKIGREITGTLRQLFNTHQETKGCYKPGTPEHLQKSWESYLQTSLVGFPYKNYLGFEFNQDGENKRNEKT